MNSRAHMFRKTCELIAQDRHATGRDASHHYWLVAQVDACARAIIRSLKHINNVIDKLYGGAA